MVQEVKNYFLKEKENTKLFFKNICGWRFYYKSAAAREPFEIER